MRVRLGEAAMVPDDFRSTDTVRFPASLDGLRKHFLDIARVLDTTDIDFRRHGIRGAEMDAADTAKALVEILLKRDVPDAVQLNLASRKLKQPRWMMSLVSVRVYFVKDSGREKMVWRLRSVQRIFSLFRSIPNSPFLRVDMVRLLS